MKFLNFLWEMQKLREKANLIRQDEEKRKRSASFGITSIIASIMAVALAAVGGVLLSLLSDNIILVILFIGFAVAFLLGAFIALYWSLVHLIWQLKINKTAWGWIALAVFILAIVGSVLVELFFIGNVF